jgi:Outer membrane protein beta-barrel domain
MRQNRLLRLIRNFFLISITSLSGCSEIWTTTLQNSSVQASVDESNVSERGPSHLSYDARTGVNTVVTADYDFAGPPMMGVNSNFNEWLPDSIVTGRTDEKPRLGLHFGLGYVGKGAKFPGGDNSTLKLNYLEIPLDVLYHYPLGPGNVHGGLGPYFAEGIGGGGANSIYGENAGGFRRFDAGLDFRVGYKLAMGLSLDLSYELGLANIEYTSTQDVTGHNRSFGINLSYQVGRLFAK